VGGTGDGGTPLAAGGNKPKRFAFAWHGLDEFFRCFLNGWVNSWGEVLAWGAAAAAGCSGDPREGPFAPWLHRLPCVTLRLQTGFFVASPSASLGLRRCCAPPTTLMTRWTPSTPPRGFPWGSASRLRGAPPPAVGPSPRALPLLPVQRLIAGRGTTRPGRQLRQHGLASVVSCFASRSSRPRPTTHPQTHPPTHLHTLPSLAPGTPRSLRHSSIPRRSSLRRSPRTCGWMPVSCCAAGVATQLWPRHAGQGGPALASACPRAGSALFPRSRRAASALQALVLTACNAGGTCGYRGVPMMTSKGPVTATIANGALRPPPKLSRAPAASNCSICHYWSQGCLSCSPCCSLHQLSPSSRRDDERRCARIPRRPSGIASSQRRDLGMLAMCIMPAPPLVTRRLGVWSLQRHRSACCNNAAGNKWSSSTHALRGQLKGRERLQGSGTLAGSLLCHKTAWLTGRASDPGTRAGGVAAAQKEAPVCCTCALLPGSWRNLTPYQSQ
jgi:hypothetical protein